MRDEINLIPVDSDVNQFLNKKRFIVKDIYNMLKNGYQESAIELLATVVVCLDNPQQFTNDLK